MKMVTDDLFSRIDSTRRKLTVLEAKLQQRLGSERYNPHLRSFLDRVGWLRGYIGIWTTRTNDGDGWDIQMTYPHTKQFKSHWPENLFGEWKEDGGHLLVFLSPSVITWLNRVDKWVSEPTVASTTV